MERQVECEPCEDAEGRSVGTAGKFPAVGGRSCLGEGTCECRGGPREAARVCPAMGFYMLTPHMSEPSMIKESLMRQVQPTVPQDDTSSFEAVADAASLEWGLFKCKPARDMA
eukprot:COSAG06_NODE_25756_length_629_cov_1.018868_1_plen_112_part_01